MSSLEMQLSENNKVKFDSINEELRQKIQEYSKNFKTSWIELGQALYAVWNDKLYYSWGFEKFEYYTGRELGLKKNLALKLLKTYYFLEQDEPSYLKEDYRGEREAINVPNYDAVNVLRLAKAKKELEKTDYLKLKKDIFDKGKDASLVRKDLTTLIKERKQVDPEKERDDRNKLAIKKIINALNLFNKDVSSLKLLPDEIIKETKKLIKKLETQLD